VWKWLQTEIREFLMVLLMNWDLKIVRFSGEGKFGEERRAM
jgi:hypothetical protein